MLNLLCLYSLNGNYKAWMIPHVFTTWLTVCVSPLLRPTAQKKRFSFKILQLIDNAHGHPRALLELYSEINDVFMPVHTASILQPMGQGVILTFKSYYLGHIFCKVVAAIDSDSSDGSGQSKLKTFWKGFTILDAMKNICDSWEEVKMSTLTGVWEKLVPTLMGDFEGFKTSVEEITSDVVEKTRELELEVEPEDGTELLPSHDIS